MEKFVTEVKRKRSDSSDSNKTKSGDHNDQRPKSKSRKHDNACVAFGFTANVVGDEEKTVFYV